MLPDDAIRGGKPQTRAFIPVLGGEKRLEDAIQRIFCHAAAGVADADHGVTAGKDPGFFIGVGIIQFNSLRFNRQYAAVRHGVPGVDRQIHQHLLQLGRTRLHHKRFGAQHRIQLNVFTDHPAHQLFKPGDDIIDIHNLHFKDLLAAECQKLPGKLPGPDPCLIDQLQQLMVGMVQAQGVQNEFSIAQNNGQQIVEVVGHPAGKPADGFHFLCLLELFRQPDLFFFRVSAFGDVPRNPPKTGCISFGIPD